jgi:phosphoserine phosphatase
MRYFQLSRRFTSKVTDSVKITEEEAKHLFRKAQAVCFDVDSTVIQEEGIDVLAAHVGAGAAVSELTRKAMGGSVKFEDALADRLKIIQPSNEDVRNCLREHPFRLTKGIKQLIDALHNKGTHVYLVSGGFRQMINPVATVLNIPRNRIFANNLLFNRDSKGSFNGFDASEPTCRDGGKPEVIRMLKETHQYYPIIMIGDGATDMQARPPADAFIGFGGVVVREPVKKGADWYIHSFDDLLSLC